MSAADISCSTTIEPTETSSPVPMLDVGRQNDPLREEFDTAIAEVVSSGAFVHGPACTKFENSMAEYCQTNFAVGCASGSDALLLALMAYGIGRGDEVILPSFTFFATAGAVWRLGAKPVFADILPGTMNIDPADIEKKLTSATKAIMPVHLFGQCVDMRAINAIAKAAGNLPVIEDAAQAIGAEQHGERAGSLGSVGCFSFYPTKNLGAFGDAGMITTNDETLYQKLRILRDHGQQPRYHHHVVGVNSRLDAVQAAVLQVKLPHLDRWSATRNDHAMRYQSELANGPMASVIELPKLADGCNSIWNQYTVRVASDEGQENRRDALQQFLADRKIGSAIYYPIPLHLQDCFAELGCKEGSLPHTEQAAREVLSLPVFPELAPAEQNRVIEAITEFCDSTTVEKQSAA